jgi:hypothetical protein
MDIEAKFCELKQERTAMELKPASNIEPEPEDHNQFPLFPKFKVFWHALAEMLGMAGMHELEAMAGEADDGDEQNDDELSAGQVFQILRFATGADRAIKEYTEFRTLRRFVFRAAVEVSEALEKRRTVLSSVEAALEKLDALSNPPKMLSKHITEMKGQLLQDIQELSRQRRFFSALSREEYAEYYADDPWPD